LISLSYSFYLFKSPLRSFVNFRTRLLDSLVLSLLKVSWYEKDHTGVWTRGLMLARQVFCHLSHSTRLLYIFKALTLYGVILSM
jgi:hypothetical protein